MHGSCRSASCAGLAGTEKKRAPIGRPSIFRRVESGSMRDVGPDLALGQIDQCAEQHEEDQDTEAGLLASPPDAARRPTSGMPRRPAILVDRLRRAVVVGHLAVRQRRRHGQRLSRDEIRIVVGALGDLHAGRRLLAVTGQQRVDVVRSALAYWVKMSKMKVGKPRSTPRALASSEKSGGPHRHWRQPRPARSGKATEIVGGMPGRRTFRLRCSVRRARYIRPRTPSPALPNSRAPPSVRKGTSCIEWQAEHTSL